MMRLMIAFLCVPAFLGGDLIAGDKKALPPDLAFVPPGCAGFIHFRVQDIWKSEHAREWRESVLKSGKETLQALDVKFIPNLSDVERVTVMFIMPEQRFNYEPDAVLILAFSKAVDRKAFLKQAVPTAKEMTEKGRTFYLDRNRNREVYFIDDQTVALSFTRNFYNFNVEPVQPAIDDVEEPKEKVEPDPKDVKKEAKKAVKEPPINSVMKKLVARADAKGMLSDALVLASSGKPIVAAFNADSIPGQLVRLLPPEYQALFRMKLAVASIDLEQEGHLDVRLTYTSSGEAASAELSAKEGISLARSFLEKERAAMEREIFADGRPAALDDLPKAAACLLALGYINKADDYLTKLPIKKSGNALTLSMKLPEGTRMFLSSGAASAALAWFSFGRGVPAPPARQFKDAPPRPKEEPESKKVEKQ